MNEQLCMHCTHYDGDACRVLGREDASTCPRYELDETIEYIEDIK